MTFEVEVDRAITDKILAKLSRLGAALDNKLLVEMVAERVKSNIFYRTSAGFDMDYKSFLPYNKQYAEKEGKTVVNLTRTGQMMNEMTQKALSADMAKIFFMTERSRKLADIHQNLGAGRSKKIRRFFGVNIRDEQDAQVLFREEIQKAKEGAGL